MTLLTALRKHPGKCQKNPNRRVEGEGRSCWGLPDNKWEAQDLGKLAGVSSRGEALQDAFVDGSEMPNTLYCIESKVKV